MKKRPTARCVVELSEVTKIFGNGYEQQTVAVRNISLHASTGELLVLLGPSGSGKTTLLTLMAGLLQPTSGTILLFGRNVHKYSPHELQKLRAARIGFVFQTFLLIDSLTAIENVALVLRFAGKSNNEAYCQAKALLDQLQIEPLARKCPPKLSQGEKQRVAIARALANKPDLVVADEPTGSLETKQGVEIIRLLHEYAKGQEKCVIVASHDLRITEFADRVLWLEDGGLLRSLTNSSHPVWGADC